MTPTQRNDLRAKAETFKLQEKEGLGEYRCVLHPDVIVALLDQLEEYEEALKFYAYYKNYRPGGLVWQDGGKKACIALNDFSWCDFYVREEWIREAIAADEQGHGG